MIQTVSPAQLAAYFDRIGYTGPREASGETLAALHRLHPQAIPFENIDTLLGLTPRLDLESVFAKLVSARRGGYCFEHNLLFRAVLETIGFETTGLAARVLWADPDAMLPRTHMMLLVETPDETWLADVGFGSMTLTAPLVFDNGREQATPHETFRLDLIERGDFKLLVKLGDTWKPVYRFDLEPQVPSDYDMANHYVSTLPDSVFVNHLIVGRVVPGQRQTLFDRTLTRRGKAEEHRDIATAAEARDALEDTFGLSLPADAKVGKLLERLVARSASATT
ncbi:arylamine N-acetyltransferase [Caballeronia sp. dw_276]|jgi:N-hydroxyarylamine O-acetyltransferase|uniref:arylamine N-acetyltransferase family protein n=1 Tax=Caballeronia sp. dw_276 TaxID=2719795 RepID=UPI001BD25F61|nr:arylamine N-acetyltransferase [Caballeronia sp. dw_276]